MWIMSIICILLDLFFHLLYQAFSGKKHTANNHQNINNYTTVGSGKALWLDKRYCFTVLTTCSHQIPLVLNQNPTELCGGRSHEINIKGPTLTLSCAVRCVCVRVWQVGHVIGSCSWTRTSTTSVWTSLSFRLKFLIWSLIKNKIKEKSQETVVASCSCTTMGCHWDWMWIAAFLPQRRI